MFLFCWACNAYMQAPPKLEAPLFSDDMGKKGILSEPLDAAAAADNHADMF